MHFADLMNENGSIYLNTKKYILKEHRQPMLFFHLLPVTKSANF